MSVLEVLVGCGALTMTSVELSFIVEDVNRFACLVPATVVLNITEYKICNKMRQAKNCEELSTRNAMLHIMQQLHYLIKDEVYRCLYYTQKKCINIVAFANLSGK